jgi:hypothetical protein
MCVALTGCHLHRCLSLGLCERGWLSEELAGETQPRWRGKKRWQSAPLTPPLHEIISLLSLVYGSQPNGEKPSTDKEGHKRGTIHSSQGFAKRHFFNYYNHLIIHSHILCEALPTSRLHTSYFIAMLVVLGLKAVR